jgi:hypothetical protein
MRNGALFAHHQGQRQCSQLPNMEAAPESVAVFHLTNTPGTAVGAVSCSRGHTATAATQPQVPVPSSRESPPAHGTVGWQPDPCRSTSPPHAYQSHHNASRLHGWPAALTFAQRFSPLSATSGGSGGYDELTRYAHCTVILGVLLTWSLQTRRQRMTADRDCWRQRKCEDRRTVWEICTRF